MVIAFRDIEFAERTSRIYAQPFVYAAAMEMVTAWKFSQLDTIVVGRKANAARLQGRTDIWNKVEQANAAPHLYVALRKGNQL